MKTEGKLLYGQLNQRNMAWTLKSCILRKNIERTSYKGIREDEGWREKCEVHNKVKLTGRPINHIIEITTRVLERLHADADGSRWI